MCSQGGTFVDELARAIIIDKHTSLNEARVGWAMRAGSPWAGAVIVDELALAVVIDELVVAIVIDGLVVLVVYELAGLIDLVSELAGHVVAVDELMVLAAGGPCH